MNLPCQIPTVAGVMTLLLSALDPGHSTCLAQGSLTPPGSPAPTMKSLDQIEARTPISIAPFTITAPGSYYVTTNLTAGVNQSGIIVAADNVTIDLNGFTLFGGGGTVGEGVSTPSARANIVVRNGTVRNWPGSGVNFYDSGSSQTLVQNVQSISNTFSGIAVRNGSRVLDCVTLGNATRGIIVDNDCLVERCKASGNVTAGLGSGASSELRNNQSTGNGIGLYITGSGNIVADNRVKANTDNYAIVQGNQLDLLLCQVPESIDWPARVRLVGSLNVTVSNAVTITANNVTFDLNGFTISSTASSATGTGILLGSGLKNITIANGVIQSGVTNNGSGVYSGSGFAQGIDYSGTAPANVLVSHVAVSGCLMHGINVGNGDSTVVESCTVRTAGNYGINASTVKLSSAWDCWVYAISGNTVSDCQGQAVGNGIIGNTALNSYGISTGDGFGLNSIVTQNCYGESGGNGGGIYAFVAENCYGQTLTGEGVIAYTAQNCYGNCASGSGYGINVAYVAFDCFGYCDGSGYGIFSASLAVGSYGFSTSGTGLSAFIANVCSGGTYTGTALVTTHNVNSF